jgi:ATP-dependent exoDNAse (exonuclease V) alpha subunit
MERTEADAYHELQRSITARSELFLVTGVKVMLIRNVDVSQGMIHGRRGWITQSATPSKDPVVRWDAQGSHAEMETTVERQLWSAKCRAGKFVYRQYPLEYAWAFTIHKAQGMTLSRALMDLSDAFSPGQIYTGLSRVRSLEDLFLLDEIPCSKIHCHPAVDLWYAERRESEHPTQCAFLPWSTDSCTNSASSSKD